MLLLLWIVNCIISIFNAWGCGKTWNETKANGGMPHFMNWMGAVMSASGFTWCYLVLAVCAAALIPYPHTVAGHEVTAPLLDEASAVAVGQLGYMVIILPVLGSGIAIGVHSWGVMWRRRTFGSTAVSAWNTFANVENVYHAARDIPGVWGSLSGFFGSDSKSRDSKAIVVALVIMACVAGILTTWSIVAATRRASATGRSLRYGA
mgnify:CR=1 FL=1